MKKVFLFLFVISSFSLSQVINFDKHTNWIQGSGAFNSYQSDHQYVEFIKSYKVTFTAHNGLRETNGIQDGFAKTHNSSNFGWNLEDNGSSSLSVKIEASEIDGFSFFLRRWEENLNLRYVISLSLNNGVNFAILSTLDNDFFNDSDWKEYIYNAHVKVDSPEYPILIKVEPFLIAPSQGNKSILVDDFSFANPLPVELTVFSASVIDNNIELSWETATEVNNYGFNIERKLETGDWMKIGFVDGHGNSNSLKQYKFDDNTLDIPGKYFYRLKQVDIDGSFEYSESVEIDIELNFPTEFELSQNFPNPFNPTTNIQFSLPETGQVKLVVFNVIGEQVAELVNKNMEAGNHNVKFDASDLNSGIYFYKIEVNGFVQIRKMMFVK